MPQIVDAHDQQADGLARRFVDAMAQGVLEFELVEQPGQRIDLALLAEIRDEAREQRGLPLRIQDEAPAAAQADPLAVAVLRAVLHPMPRRAAVDDLLVGREELPPVVFVHLRSPHGRGVLHHFRRQGELLHHGPRVAEHAGLHVAHVQVVVSALHERIVEPVAIVEELAGIGVGALGLGAPERLEAAVDVVALLLGVHALVRAGEQLVQLERRLRVELGDAVAESRIVGRIGARGQRGQRCAGALHLLVRLGRVAAENADELVAAQAEPVVAVAVLAAHGLRDGADEDVALRVPVRVVHVLEAVDVVERDRERLLALARAGHGKRQLLLARAP